MHLSCKLSSARGAYVRTLGKRKIKPGNIFSLALDLILSLVMGHSGVRRWRGGEGVHSEEVFFYVVHNFSIFWQSLSH